MKQFLLAFIVAICTTQAYAQDIIITRNGDEIQAKVTKVSSNEIEYKKWTNQDGPLYTINKGEVFLIKYANGEKDLFTNDKQAKVQLASNITEPKSINKQPADNNKQLIDRYKVPIHFARTTKNKNSKWFFPIMTMSDSSIVSTPDIEMKIVPTTVWDNTPPANVNIKYSIELLNKTDKIIYIDLANTFRIYCDGTSKNYFNTEQTSVNQSSGSGAGFNIGGITNALGVGGVIGALAGATTIGGATQHSVSTTYTNQRILAIPPHSKKDLSEYKQVMIKRNSYKTISDLEIYGFYKNDLRPILKKDGYISYSEEESPYTAQYIITYSTVQDFSEYSSLYAKLYARYVYGGYYSTIFAKRQKKAIQQIQQYIPNFWEDPGIIVGFCTFMSKKK